MSCTCRWPCCRGCGFRSASCRQWSKAWRSGCRRIIWQVWRCTSAAPMPGRGCSTCWRWPLSPCSAPAWPPWPGAASRALEIMRPLILIAAAFALVIALILALPTPFSTADSAADPENFAITGVRVFDGQAFLEAVDVIVRDGRIEHMGPGLSIPRDLTPIDGRGQTLLPGLIDAHVHTFGQAQADALRFGVTTLLDMFTSPAMLPEARRQRAQANQSQMADLYSAGVLATARGGHGTQYGIPVPPVSAPEDAKEWVAARVAEGSDFIKIVIEPGRLWGTPRPTLDEPTVRALVTAAHAHGLMTLAHVSTEADAIMAVEAGVDGLVHVFADRPASAEFLNLARERGVFVVPTTVVMAGVGGQLDLDALLAEDGIGERLSVEQQASLRGAGWSAPNGQALLAQSLENTAVLHTAGIPLLAGSDAPNPGTAHGLSVHVELEFLVQAGMRPDQALHAATLLPAEHFGLEDRGCIRTGCRADLLLVNGDPGTDIRATRQIAAVWKNGLPVTLERSPAETAAAGTARAATDLLSAAEIARWMPSDDRFLGGRSEAQLERDVDGKISVGGELAAGSQFAYAGLLWSAGQPFMSPIDLTERKRLLIRVRGDSGPWMAMLFSGATPGAAAPLQLPLIPGGDGAGLNVNLADVAGLEMGQFQAIGVFAVGSPRDFGFELVEARLE
ncbi:MAG: amidohydrolase [Wenzhouxiangella sp.]|nr:MAG: amidohydrolase [Wenzhouxiangella sp.]